MRQLSSRLHTGTGNCGGTLIAAAGKASSSTSAQDAVLGMHQHRLPHVGGTGAKAGLAIREVEAPGAHEAVIEALRLHLRSRGVETTVPAAQRLGVVEAESVHAGKGKTLIRRFRAKAFRRRQH